MLEKVNPKKVFFSRSYEMHVTTKHNFNTPITEVEKRSIIDSCEHAGNKHIYIEGE